MEEVERDCITPDSQCPDEFSHVGQNRQLWEHKLRLLLCPPVPAELCRAAVAAPGAPVLHGRRKTNDLSPPGIVCNVFINHL